MCVGSKSVPQRKVVVGAKVAGGKRTTLETEGFKLITRDGKRVTRDIAWRVTRMRPPRMRLVDSRRVKQQATLAESG